MVLLLSGCASYGVVDNKAVLADPSEPSYSIKTGGNKGSGEISLFLAFSGGGTRAAAPTYGVMQELRDTTFFSCSWPWSPKQVLKEGLRSSL